MKEEIKTKDQRSRLKEFASLTAKLRGRGGRYLLAAILNSLSVFLGFLSPLILAELIDHYLGSAPSKLPSWLNDFFQSSLGEGFISSNLWLFGLALFIVSVLNSFINYYKDIHQSIASEDIANGLRKQMFKRLQSMSYDYHVKAETGDLLQRCSSDIDTVRRFFERQFLGIYGIVFQISLALALMIPINRKITFLALAPLPLLTLFCFVFFKYVSRAYDREEKTEAKLSSTLQENLTGVRVVRAFGQQRAETERFSRANDNHNNQQMKTTVLDSLYWSSGDLFSAIQMIIVLVACIYGVMTGTLSIGSMVLLTSYSGMLVFPARQLGRMLSSSGRAMVASKRIDEVLSSPEENLPGDKTPSIRGDIEFRNVSFSYDGKRNILDGISFKIKQGQRVGILAGTGDGKTSLVLLLQRLYEPTGGDIFINGVSIREISPKHLRERVGLILQEPFLFSRSIEDNISISLKEKNHDSVVRASKLASALEFINESEKGFETMVGEKGVTLSGGQKQRVAIARTLINEHDILIFDDSLSAVDTKTDLEIRTALKDENKGTTSFIISHRLTTLKDCDVIIVMKSGRLLQMGSHEELLKEDGLYKRIFDIQQGV